MTYKSSSTRLGLLAALTMCFAVAVPTKVLAATADSTNYEEVTYDDLVHEISNKRASVARQASEKNDPNVLDELTLHLGVGLVMSSFNANENGSQKQFSMSGFQLSGGVDLFSPNYVAEGAIRNFGSQSGGSESYSFRELDLKVMYRSPGHGSDIGYRFGTGLATRYLTFSDGGFSSDGSTQAMILFGGMETSFSKNLGIGFELGYRSVMTANNVDGSSVDLMLRLDGFL